MALWLRAFAVLMENPGSISTWQLTTNSNSGTRESDKLFWLLSAPGIHMVYIHTYIHMDDIDKN